MKALIAFAALLGATPAFAANYAQGPGSNLAFATKYQGETFTGRFGKFDTKLSLDPKNLANARLSVSIQVATASTDNAERDGYLLGADFFAPKQFATATFVSRSIRQTAKDQYVASGTLTLRGISKPVSFSFSLKPTAQGAQLIGKATVKRLDFGVGSGKDWRDLSVIPNDVAVSTRVNLKKAP